MAWQDVHNGAFDGFRDFWSDIIPDNMPSTRSLSGFAVSALGAAQSVLGSPLTSPDPKRAIEPNGPVCSSPQLSCHNTTAVSNLCCFNAPGGQLLQTQFWDTSPATGPSDSWTIHGLWPDHCDGTYDATCDPSRAYTNITQILQSFGATDVLSYMQTYWKTNSGTDETFWEHEWSKHGTCISTLDTDCYTNYKPTEEVVDFFTRTTDLFKNLTSYEWLAAAGITPSSSATYTSAQILDALSSPRGGYQATISCSSSELNQIFYYFNVRGSVQSGTFVDADPDGSKSACPSTGIKYLPKDSSSSPTSTTATGTSAAPTATLTGSPFSGKGVLNVQTGGSTTGCIISAGKWYTTGTCATFTATTSGDGFTLTSSKGNCAISGGALTCGSNVTTASVFDASGAALEYDGEATFYADSVPSGSTQGTVYTSSSHTTSLQITWQST